MRKKRSEMSLTDDELSEIGGVPEYVSSMKNVQKFPETPNYGCCSWIRKQVCFMALQKLHKLLQGACRPSQQQ